MELEQTYRDTPIEGNVLQEVSASKNFMANVFIWMFAALSISAISAFVFMSSPTLLMSLVNETGLNLLGKIIMFAPLGFVLLMSFGFQRLSLPVLSAVFILYSIINGISFSFILMIYTPGSVLSCFIAAAIMFGVMAVLGYTTDKDLTSFGRIMFMGLIGIVVVSLVNFFMQSEMVSYIIGIVGVLVFTGLTAYDVQKLKNISRGFDANGNTLEITDTRKLAVMGALSLYLDFINLFLSLLRVFGRKN
ncbi:MAG: Bax inhibitor-1/YccA family protein [Bacteroidota bacterium]|nr:MAG: Bax inhibitor-1/YccA family protein [Bacteroidota bacterium]